MAVKTFTQGEKLTASDTNTYLNNGGLVYIGKTTYSAAGAVSVNGVFTSTYQQYRVVGMHNPSANLANFNMRLRASSTDQSGANYQTTTARLYTNVAIDVVSSGATTAQMSNGGISSNPYGFTIDIFDPANNTPTIWTYDASNFEAASAAVRWWSTGGYKANYAADGFTIYPGSGTWTGSLIVYGYRQP